MKTATPNDTIDVQALRVGMFVHLDGGWMSHPFPLSNFRITSSAQLATIRSLGLHRVRWSPQQSDLDEDDATVPAPMVAAELPPVAAANDDRGAGPDAEDTMPHPPPGLGASTEPGALAVTKAQFEGQRQLTRQREAKECCERQYAEAARACRQTFDLVVTRPEEARAHAEKLSRALLDKMIGAEELCIRVLGESAGDKASLHGLNVAIVSLLMGRCFGFDADEMMDVGVGAMLHDVGKIELPVRLRYRDDTFSPNELRVYREHVQMGVAQARRMGLTAGASAVIAQHHEHADGSGDGLGVVGRDVQSSDAVGADHLGQRADRRHDERGLAGHQLDRRQAEPLVQAGDDAHLGRPEERHQTGFTHPTDKAHVPHQAQPLNRGGSQAALAGLADDDELDVALGAQLGDGFEERDETFERYVGAGCRDDPAFDAGRGGRDEDLGVDTDRYDGQPLGGHPEVAGDVDGRAA